MAVGFVERKAGLSQFTEARVHDPAVLAFAAKIRYEVDPANEYPRRFTGHLRAALHDGTHKDIRPAYLRGGAAAPLSRAELEQKFMNNARHGGWLTEPAERLLGASRELFGQPTLDILKEFRAWASGTSWRAMSPW